MIQGNILGFIMMAFSAVFVAIGAFLLKLPDWIVMISAGVILVITDFVFRVLQKKQTNWLMAKNLGGYLYFIPVWIFGFLVIAINIIAHFTKK